MGSIYRPKYKDKNGKVRESKKYWIKYYRNGKPYRESSKSTKESEAKRLLRKREGEISEGKPPGIYFDKVRFDELAEDFLRDYRLNNKTVARARQSMNHLMRFFNGRRITEITTPVIEEYIEKRIRENAAKATVNRELAALKRAFNLGAKNTPAKVGQVPYIPMLKEDNARKGFFEHEEFEALRNQLPDYLKDFVTFAYKTGWRKSEISSLVWSQVDRKNGIVYLNPGETKNSEARAVYLDEELKEIFEARWEARKRRKTISPYVFEAWDGESRIGDIRKAWNTACEKAGIGKRLFHDFRRTAVRNMIRSGIPERVAMMISGHKTRSVFDRYNIVNDQDLRLAAQKQEEYINSQISGTGKVLGKVRKFEKTNHS